MTLKENRKRFYSYSAGKAFVRRNVFALLIGLLIFLQPVIWFAVRSLEDTLPFNRCGYDYSCRLIVQPEPRL